MADDGLVTLSALQTWFAGLEHVTMQAFAQTLDEQPQTTGSEAQNGSPVHDAAEGPSAHASHGAGHRRSSPHHSAHSASHAHGKEHSKSGGKLHAHAARPLPRVLHLRKPHAFHPHKIHKPHRFHPHLGAHAHKGHGKGHKGHGHSAHSAGGHSGRAGGAKGFGSKGFGSQGKSTRARQAAPQFDFAEQFLAALTQAIQQSLSDQGFSS